MGRLSASLARLVVNLFVARIFGDALGLTAEYQKVWLLFNTTYMVFIFGIPASLYYFYPRLEPSKQARFLSQSIWLLFALGLLYMVLLRFSAPLVGKIYAQESFAWHMSLFSLYGFAMVASSFLEPILNLFQRFRLLAGWMVLESLLFLGAALFPIWVGTHPKSFPAIQDLMLSLAPNRDPMSTAIHASFILITLLSCIKLVASHVLLSQLKQGLYKLFSFDRTMLVQQLRWALPITMTTMVAFLATYMDKNVIAAFFDDGATYAIFQAGAMEVPLVSVLVGSVSAVMLPHLSRLQHAGRFDELKLLLASSVEKVAWLVFPMFALLMVLADPLYIFFWGPDYAASALPFRLYLLIVPLRLMFYGQVLNTLGKARWVFWTALFDLLLNLGLSLVLVRVLGMPGPAIATVVATLAEISVFMFLLARTLNCSIFHIFRPNALARIAMVSLAATGGALLGRYLASTHGEAILYGTLLHVGIFLLLLWKTGTIKTLMHDEVALEN
jgi:O-antigen/teichoic acid export membrane protein